MKTPGDYALMQANGMSWADMVEEIRFEAVADYRGLLAPDIEVQASCQPLVNIQLQRD